MCLAIPVRIVELEPDQMARVSLDGVTKLISVALVDDIAIGDYVILHAGFALSKVDPGEAERTLTMIREIAGSAT
jgi:hydrogenase expression/formation protein HypC